MPTSRTLFAAVAIAAIAAVPTVPTGGIAIPAACATDLGAATDLVAELPTGEAVAAQLGGLDTLVVTDALVPPGIPNVLLPHGPLTCTVEAFNLAAAPSLDGPAAVASAFASTAAMPWLGEVEVHDVTRTGGVISLQTIGGRHAVASDWSIAVDELGVRSATFVTTDFAVGQGIDDLHGLEGITSLPGHGRTWIRDAAGLLRIDRTIADDLAASIADREAATERAARAAGLAPGDLLEGDLDGQVVRYTLGFAAPTVETPPFGQDLADRLNYVDRGMDLIFDQYEEWGATDVWGSSARTFFGFSTVPDEAGYVNFDSPIAAYCLACAFLGDFIEIHQLLAFGEIIESPAFGTSYPDDNSLALEVAGHEFTHVVQGGYGDGNVGLTNAFYEATAVASQSLYHEAENSNQEGSLEYGDNGNACNGFENGRGGWIAAQADGPFLDGHTYDACWFWWTYVAEHGGEGLVRLMEVLPDLRGQGNANIDRHLLQLDLASPTGDGAVDLARWAAAYTAGTDADGYVVVDGSGDANDWLAPMQPAEWARDLAPGASLAVTLADGGTVGFRVTGDATLTALPAGTRAFTAQVVDSELVFVGEATVGQSLSGGTLLAVVRDAPGSTSGTVALG